MTSAFVVYSRLIIVHLGKQGQIIIKDEYA